MAYLSSGFGGLILCAKPEEPELWRRYCELSGRLADLIEFCPKNPWRFDPLGFELSRCGAGGGHTENLVQMFATLLDLGEKDGGRGGPANRGQVDAIVFKNGSAFKATGRNWMKVMFKQDFGNK